MLGLIQCKIQRGTSGVANATSYSATVAAQTLTVTIEEVSDVNKCIVLVDGYATATLTDETTLSIYIPPRLYASNMYTAGPTLVNWQVIELGGAVSE